MINKKRLIKLAQQLIRINSENPCGTELNIARFVKDYLARLRLRPKIYEFVKKRSNVVCVLKGKHAERSLLITPHLDTVPRGKNWHFPPFAAKISGDRIYGLGASDCKGNLAVALEAINSLLEERHALDYDLIFAATADEESGSVFGLEPLLNKKIIACDSALVLDSDDFNIIVAQKGLLHLKIKVEGKRAHGAYPWLGRNAIDEAIKAINAIKAYGFARRKYPFLKGPTINIGTIKGGDKVNVVADWCEVEIDFRFLPGEPVERLLGRIKEIVRKNCRQFEIEVEGIQKPFEIEVKHPLVQCLKKAMRAKNISPVICGSEGATTISFFQELDIPSVATGFGVQGCAHAPDEFAKISNLFKGAQVLEEFLKNYKFKR